MRTLQWALSAGLACAALIGCEKSSETQRKEADQASLEADKKKVEATNEADQQTREAREKVDRERDDLHATVMREKADYRTKVHDALGKLDKDLTDLKIDATQVKRGDRSGDRKLFVNRSQADFDKIERILIRRDGLMEVSNQIDRAIDHDWPALKQRIDRELEDKDKPVKPGKT